jgi:hypothetical protein
LVLAAASSRDTAAKDTTLIKWLVKARVKGRPWAELAEQAEVSVSTLRRVYAAAK